MSTLSCLKILIGIRMKLVLTGKVWSYVFEWDSVFHILCIDNSIRWLDFGTDWSALCWLLLCLFIFWVECEIKAFRLFFLIVFIHWILFLFCNGTLYRFCDHTSLTRIWNLRSSLGKGLKLLTNHLSLKLVEPLQITHLITLVFLFYDVRDIGPLRGQTRIT